MSDPSAPEPDYAHAHDAQADRTRIELWVILAVVIAVLAGAFIWRAATGKPAGPQAGWNRNDPNAAAPPAIPAAGAGIPPHGAAAPPPRPAAP